MQKKSPSRRKTGYETVYGIYDKLTHKLLYVGVTAYTVSRRCSGNPFYNYKTMYTVVLQTYETRAQAEEVETQLILHYKLQKEGYNKSSGPRGTGLKQTKEHIATRVKSRAGYVHSDNTRNKIAKANGFKVKCVETGQIFYSMAEAARWCNGTDTKISMVTRGKRKTHKGYHWKLVE